jgi:GDP-L-fucose synthase
LTLNRSSKIFVAGHQGMVGSAILRRLHAAGYANLLTRSHAQLDLLDQSAVHEFFRRESPDYVFLAAAKVGGIHANNIYRADFLYQNLQIQNNVIHAAFGADCQRLMFLGSSCIYPRDCPQPIKEEYLLTGLLEQTNEPYAIAKIAGIKLCESFNRQYGTKYISVMPTNLYGPNDNYDLETSHVLPALIRKAHLLKLAVAADREGIVRDEECFGRIPDDFRKLLENATSPDARPSLVVWGTGMPRREFLYVDDMAEACVFLMEKGVNEGLYNVGSATDLPIRELAELVLKVIGYQGGLILDRSKPDGTPRKLLDVSRLQREGWAPRISLEEGISRAYQDYKQRLLQIPAGASALA